MSSQEIVVRAATEKDVGTLHQMVRREAEYEKMVDHFSATEEGLRTALFGPRPVAEALIAWAGEEAVGFTVFFTTFSTFSAQQGIWMEDLFVEQKWRGHGVGRKLLSHLGALAIERGCHGVNWSVFKWNENAIGFYRGCGASELTAWDYYSLSGDSLRDISKKR